MIRRMGAAVATISKGGQISIPAPVRRRWATARILIEDKGDRLVITPWPDDPIGAAMGSLPRGLRSPEDIRAESREEEAEIEDRKWGRLPDRS